jgi:hypothetical protein
MSFTENEAKAKIGKTVCVQSDAFSEDGIVKGTTGRVSDALRVGTVELGVGNHFTGGNSEEVWTVSVSFNGSGEPILVSKEEYENNLQEVP